MNRKQENSKELFLIMDGVLLGLCFWLCYFLRSTGLVRLDSLFEIPPFQESYWMLALIVAVTPLLLDMQGFYQNPLTETVERRFIEIIKAGFWLFLILGAVFIFGRQQVPSRSVLILFLVTAPVVLIIRDRTLRSVLMTSYRSGKIGDRTVIVGLSRDIGSFMQGLGTAERMELQITQHFDLEKTPSSEIRKQIRQHAAGRVIFVSWGHPENKDLPSECEHEGIDVWVVMNSMSGLSAAPSLSSLGKSRVLIFRKTRSEFWYRFSKRLIDFLGAIAGLIILSPLCLLIALAIKLTSPGPVIFRQVRSGRRGRRFGILKFRTMIPNAPALHAELAHRNEMEGPVFKISKDPRVTPIGAFLRRTSLDEIPQLINVLRGEMSLVGPRPLPDYETERIEKSTHRRRLSVKPGMTCLWQIRGRSTIRNFDDWVKLDIEYIDNASFLLDLWILIRTVPTVFFMRGSH